MEFVYSPKYLHQVVRMSYHGFNVRMASAKYELLLDTYEMGEQLQIETLTMHVVNDDFTRSLQFLLAEHSIHLSENETMTERIKQMEEETAQFK